MQKYRPNGRVVSKGPSKLSNAILVLDFYSPVVSMDVTLDAMCSRSGIDLWKQWVAIQRCRASNWQKTRDHPSKLWTSHNRCQRLHATRSVVLQSNVILNKLCFILTLKRHQKSLIFIGYRGLTYFRRYRIHSEPEIGYR